MSTATVSAFIDKYHPQQDGKCAVTIRVTHQRKKKYYPTGMSLTAYEFERIKYAKRRNEVEKAQYHRLHSFVSKALEVVQALTVFTFAKFEEIYLENREASDSIAFGFDKYITELREEKRIGTAVSYEVAKKSLEAFQKGLKYADVTKSMLTQYETWMLENGKSRTTVGIYLRSLRAIFNRTDIDKSLYPFGEGKNKYSIPTSRNIKKALTLKEISKIFNYQAHPGSAEEMARDYWIFIYLCNGLNVKDMCLLKRKDITGNVLKFERSKTKRNKKDGERIVVSLKPEARAVIGRWGQASIDPEAYVFPYLQKSMTPERERKIIQQVTKTINKYMKRIAEKSDIKQNVTTYYARHSFATVLKRSGVSTEYISEALGHSDLKTTKSYLAGFEEDTIHQTTEALTAFSS